MDERNSFIFVYILVVLFGASTWMSINGLFVELPVIVYDLPEGYGLASFLAVIIQVAFIGVVVFGLWQRCANASVQRHLDKIILSQLVFATLAEFLLAIFWNKTAHVAGAERSVAIYILSLCVSLVACTSNVTFLPYMGRFKPQFIVAFFVGMGMGSLLPSILALIQGSGKVLCVTDPLSGNVTANVIPPRFGFAPFTGILGGVMVLSTLAFLILNSKLCENQRANPEASTGEIINEKDEVDEIREGQIIIQTCPNLSTGAYMLLLGLTGWISALMNGILPSLQTYSGLPYGQLTYHLAVALSCLVNPLACFIQLFWKLSSVAMVILISLVATVVSNYCVTMAALSPEPLLYDKIAGQVLIIVAWIVSIGLCAFLRTVMADMLRERSGPTRPKALFWCGAFTQAGAFLGSILLFPLVNVYHLFHAAPICR